MATKEAKIAAGTMVIETRSNIKGTVIGAGGNPNEWLVKTESAEIFCLESNLRPVEE